MQRLETKLPHAATNEPLRYEAPAIESVLTSGELEREVAYAGGNQVSPPPNGPNPGPTPIPN